MSFQIGGIRRWGVVLGMTACLVVGAEVYSADDGSARAMLVAQKTQKKKPAPKKGNDAIPKDEMATTPAPSGKGAAAPADGMLSFKKDIAPILIANCVGCHSGNGPGLRTGKLDMTTFEKLMAGGKRGKDIIGGSPEESHLVLMIKGQETPKMPRNNGQQGFAEEAIEKIATWVKQGARLDAGLSATDPMAKYAASIDDLRKAELAKLSPEERDKIAEATGRERWKKATKVEPEVTSSAKGGHFLLLSNLPKERATKLLQTMEAQFTLANKFLSSPKATALSPTEKISLYVFKENVSFVEFVRTNEMQEVESGEQARAKLSVETPYIVAVDPANGGEEVSQSASKKGSRKKKAEESLGGPERTLAGLLTEQLVAAAANKMGKPPRWVSLGLGAFLASNLEANSPYYRNLRKETAENFRIGWQVKASEALGGEAKAETIRAIGFSIFEWMAANGSPAVIANFVQVMLEGQAKLDEAIGNCLSMTRQEFLDSSGLWLAERYGRL